MVKYLELFESEELLTNAVPSAYPWVGAESSTKKVRYMKKAATAE